MTSIQLTVTGAAAVARKQGLLTAGMTGIPVTFSFSPEWEGLQIIPVFRCGDIIRDNVLTDFISVVPHEVLQPGLLYIGAEGRNADGTLVIPTVWALAGQVLESAAASGNEAIAPTPSQFDRLMGEVERVEEKLDGMMLGQSYASMPFDYNENAGLITDFLLLQPAPFDGIIEKVRFRAGTPDSAIPEITVFDWDGETLHKDAFVVVERFRVRPVSGAAQTRIPIRKGQYIGVTEGTGTVCRWYSGAAGAGFVYNPEADSGIKRYDGKYITLSYEMVAYDLPERVGLLEDRLAAAEESTAKVTDLQQLRQELSYDRETWGEAEAEKTSDDYVASGAVQWGYGYIKIADGIVASDTDENWRNTTAYIPVTGGDVICVKNSITAHASVAMIACYDKNKSYMVPYSQALVKGDATYTVPENTGIAYVRVTLGNRVSATAEPTFHAQQVYIITHCPVASPKENLDHLYRKVTALEKATALNMTATPLAGKTVFLAGDSRSSTDYTFYKTLLESKCGCTALVQGASGRNVAYNASDAYFSRLIANPHDFSIWIVGGNDTGAAGTIGTFRADSANGLGGEAVVEETDITQDYAGSKFIQAVDHMMRKYKALFYDFKQLGNRHIPRMIFCTDLPQQRSNAQSAWSLRENWERKRNAIIECCEKNHVACLDLYKLCNFDMDYEPYWVSPTDKVNDNGLYFMDGLHPNQYGMDVITSLEIEEMKKYVMTIDYIKPRAIVSDGLVLYCDGIDNTGHGHDDTVTTWTDLSESGNHLINVADATATAAAETVQGAWMDTGMRVVTEDSQFLRTVNPFDLGADRTLEMRVTLNTDANMALGFKGADRVKFRAAGAKFWVRVSASDSSNTQDITGIATTTYNTPVAVTITRSYDASATATTYMVYVNGTYMRSKTMEGDHRTGEAAHLLFGMENDDIILHSVRVYNRVLTAVEVQNNYLYDADHFA